MKRDGAERFGAELVFAGTTSPERRAKAEEIAKKEKLIVVPPFDHRHIIGLARERLKQKALYSIVPAYALPEKFTLPELQRIHEVLIGKRLQKKSFRRRIGQSNLLLDTGLKRQEGGRPATLYKMRARSGRFTFVRNLEE